MKPKTKLPKARVIVSYSHGHDVLFLKGPDDGPAYTCALIPAPTAKQARQIVKAAPFLNMTEGEQVETLRKLLARNWTGSYEEDALAVLAAIRGSAK